MPSLAEIRARIAQQENKSNKTSSGPSDNSIYPHWNAEEGSTVTARFLPDGNTSNTFFWVERQLIRLAFNGVVGNSNAKQVVVQVPCMEMYGESCPILAEVRPWYKDESLKEMANKYWKKRSYIFQGFVRQNPLADDKSPENPIRKFIISPQIFAVIKSSLMDPEMEELPTDYVHGVDFNIKKSSKGGYADYSTSNWARKETALTETEQSAIEQYGLFDLASFLPKKPTEAELNIIKEMFDASVDGQPYNLEKWGSYYRPYGLDMPNTGSAAPSAAESAPVKTPVEFKSQSQASTEESSTPPWEDEPVASAPVKVPAPKASSNDKAEDILKMIRARQNKS